MVAIAGADIGNRQDNTAVVLLDTDRFQVADCWTVPLRTPYSEVQAQLGALVPTVGKLVIDASGCGEPIYQALASQHGPQVVGVVFTGGKRVRGERTASGSIRLRVPKAMMMDRLQAALADGLTVADSCRPAGRHEFQRQLAGFIVKPGPHPRYEAKSGLHDDLVAAAALAMLARGL